MTYHLDPNQVPEVLKSGYNGRNFQVEAATEITINNHAGYWDGGSRDTFYVVRLRDGQRASLNDKTLLHPGKVQAGEITYPIPPGIVVVEHSIFCGKDMGLRFYVHPNDIAPMLPVPVKLSENEEFVLKATQRLKASYAGKSRRQNAIEHPDDVHWKFRGLIMTEDDWDAVKAILIIQKMLNKAGAITTKGKNAIQG